MQTADRACGLRRGVIVLHKVENYARFCKCFLIIGLGEKATRVFKLFQMNDFYIRYCKRLHFHDGHPTSSSGNRRKQDSYTNVKLRTYESTVEPPSRAAPRGYMHEPMAVST